MEIKVHIISKQAIKPSSPTPHHLRTHRFSVIDQLAPRSYIPVLLFYTTYGQSRSEISNRLKASLAKTLAIFYPFAGRVKNNSHVECNDEGATFIEANVECGMQKILRQSAIQELQLLLPWDPEDRLPYNSDRELLGVQVNHFSDGGVTVGVEVNHKVADASSVSVFLQSWTAIARTDDYSYVSETRLKFDLTALFPKMDALDFISSDYSFDRSTAQKRLVFEGSKIAALRKRIASDAHIKNPTRYEAVGALIWGAFIAACSKREEPVTDYVLGTAVDMRRRIDIPSSEQCIGNMSVWTATRHFIENKSSNYHELAEKIRESVRNSSKDWSLDEYLSWYNSISEESAGNPKLRIFAMSWVKFPFYDVDLGWGKPLWVANAITPEAGVYFVDTADAKGMEAWIGLPKEIMAEFLQNPDVLAYVSPSHSFSRL
ncbi:hypothetical protein K2173_020235 [Erythroxylum novogranatense]|uniref:Uncharacterized protein n=1 Tax=Erythroxylum novogranatense TaxID=1862640 RepID=A0AAV8U8M4_9ROSI|nr:hypothetical protein K2173_020235 [Erythroxylum novogranatense]